MLLLCLLCASPLLAQVGSTLVGNVTDENGEPLPGANVVVMNNGKMARGTSTNINGDFKIEVQMGKGDNELHVSYLGSKTRIIKLSTETFGKGLKIELEPDNAMLAEVTVVEDGYARLPRKDGWTVYTTMGVKVVETTDASIINALPSGIYIINGKKVVK